MLLLLQMFYCLLHMLFRALKKLWQLKIRPCCKKRCSGKVDDNEVTEAPKPMPNDWEIERSKEDLDDFTLAEYTEKVILYGFLMVTVTIDLFVLTVPTQN